MTFAAEESTLPHDDPSLTTWDHGPHATVCVDHDIDGTPGGSFFFQPYEGDCVDVTVHESGDLVVDWQPWRQGGRIRLRFEMVPSSDQPELAGLSLGWSGTSLPETKPRTLRFSARKLTVVRDGTPTQLLEVELDRDQMGSDLQPITLTYHLTVVREGSPFVVDPKICNKGDGVSDGCA